MPSAIADARVTIVGAGVIGLSIAQALPTDWAIQVIARDLPGDASLGFASPWAGAAIGGDSESDPAVIAMLRNSYAWFSKCSHEPESGVTVRCLSICDFC